MEENECECVVGGVLHLAPLIVAESGKLASNKAGAEHVTAFIVDILPLYWRGAYYLLCEGNVMLEVAHRWESTIRNSPAK